MNWDIEFLDRNTEQKTFKSQHFLNFCLILLCKISHFWPNFSHFFYIFVNYSNSSNYQLPGPLFWSFSNQCIQVTQIPQITSYPGSFFKYLVLWITQIPWNTDYYGLWFNLSPTLSKLLKFSKIPVSEGSFFLISFCELLKFPEIPITRALVLTILQPMCPSYPNSLKYQLPGVLFISLNFVNY